jgi:hypothetical protein
LSIAGCPEFLKPRLRLFLSADIVGSTSLKQVGSKPDGAGDSGNGPSWFSAIQGFYFEAVRAFLGAWERRKADSRDAVNLHGESPVLWKTIGDEVLFTKVITDHRQLAVTLDCWMQATREMREFLKRESPSLDVKCTAWTAGFPYRNREIAVDRRFSSPRGEIDDYHKENGRLLGAHYANPTASAVVIDYIGPSIDLGFRLTGYSSNRKMVVSVDIAYILSRTNDDDEAPTRDLHFDGTYPLKGVMGGALYPIFWINMSGANSLADKEDRLKFHQKCNRDDVKAYAAAFYDEYAQFTFAPFITDDKGGIFDQKPTWYDVYHDAIVKNFTAVSEGYDTQAAANGDDGQDAVSSVPDIESLLADAELPPPPKLKLRVGDAVRHVRLGSGIVRTVNGNDVGVEFKTGRKETISSAFLIRD